MVATMKTTSLIIILFVSFLHANVDANGKKKNPDPRSQTEAVGADRPCVDCVVNSAAFGNSNFGDLRALSHKTTIFSKDKNQFVDPREVLDRQANPQLNAIGLIKVFADSNVPPRDVLPTPSFKPGRQGGLGSGFLINECLVVTNHHVAFIGRDAKDISKSEIEFMAGASGNPNSPFAFKSKGKVVAHGNYKTANDKQNDWAIIKLDQPVANPKNPNDIRADWRITPVFTDVNTALDSSAVTASFYQDDNKYSSGIQLWGQKDCEIIGPGSGSAKGTWATNCAAIPGASGSPIMTETRQANGHKELMAYGIIQSVRDITSDKAMKMKDENLNNLLPFSEMMTKEKLEKIIKDNPCTTTLSI